VTGQCSNQIELQRHLHRFDENKYPKPLDPLFHSAADGRVPYLWFTHKEKYPEIAKIASGDSNLLKNDDYSCCSHPRNLFFAGSLRLVARRTTNNKFAS
jgi:hypothetical protein